MDFDGANPPESPGFLVAGCTGETLSLSNGVGSAHVIHGCESRLPAPPDTNDSVESHLYGRLRARWGGWYGITVTVIIGWIY
jgi:hypothetical protein